MKTTEEAYNEMKTQHDNTMTEVLTEMLHFVEREGGQELRDKFFSMLSEYVERKETKRNM